jgi:hypothetical protein
MPRVVEWVTHVKAFNFLQDMRNVSSCHILMCEHFPVYTPSLKSTGTWGFQTDIQIHYWIFHGSLVGIQP